ncbi:hypothetical protein AWH62_11910 [Maricaulis sp. W15]|nr:hypothetical protein AWH62_11910 [Maricaulis sp. W15]
MGSVFAANWIEGCGGRGQGVEWAVGSLLHIRDIPDACPAKAGRRSGTYTLDVCRADANGSRICDLLSQASVRDDKSP